MNYSIETEEWQVAEPEMSYGGNDYPLQDETFRVIGLCMDVHRELGHGFLESVYKEALELEFKWNKIPFEREKHFKINYKGQILNREYIADFTVMDTIILEVKAQQGIINEHYRQTINYLAVSKCKVALLVNFGEPSLKFKRIVL